MPPVAEVKRPCHPDTQVEPTGNSQTASRPYQDSTQPRTKPGATIMRMACQGQASHIARQACPDSPPDGGVDRVNSCAGVLLHVQIRSSAPFAEAPPLMSMHMDAACLGRITNLRGIGGGVTQYSQLVGQEELAIPRYR